MIAQLGRTKQQMEKEKVSVIVPVYNDEKYLADCVDSILHQSYQNLELILVDDGSTDNSAQICEDYREREALRQEVLMRK